MIYLQQNAGSYTDIQCEPLSVSKKFTSLTAKQVLKSVKKELNLSSRQERLHEFVQTTAFKAKHSIKNSKSVFENLRRKFAAQKDFKILDDNYKERKAIENHHNTLLEILNNTIFWNILHRAKKRSSH